MLKAVSWRTWRGEDKRITCSWWVPSKFVMLLAEAEKLIEWIGNIHILLICPVLLSLLSSEGPPQQARHNFVWFRETKEGATNAKWMPRKSVIEWRNWNGNRGTVSAAYLGCNELLRLLQDQIFGNNHQLIPLLFRGRGGNLHVKLG